MTLLFDDDQPKRQRKPTTHRGTSKRGQHCGDCQHLIVLPHPTIKATPIYTCGHYDLLELDSNAGGREIGFADVKPGWCPLENLGNAIAEPK